MKKKTLVSSLVLSTMILGLAPLTTFAADNAKTSGDVKFEANEDVLGGNPGEPKDGSQIPITNSEDPNNPGQLDGNWGKGAVRLEWVPNMHFGTQKISSGDEYYAAAWQDKVIIDPAGANLEVEKYPQYAQVTNESGNNASEWKINVKQTVFKGKDNGADVELPNTMITLYNTQAYNSNSVELDPAEAQKTTQSIVTLKDVKNEVGGKRLGTAIGGAGVELAATTNIADPVNSKPSNGTKTSIVFAEADQFNGEVTTNTRTANNEAIKLFSPAKDVKIAGVTYTADLIWDLTIAL